MEITGFSGGIPGDVTERWPKDQNGRKYTFGKVEKSPKHFVYYCQRSMYEGNFNLDVSTGYETDRDLTHQEVEQRQQFVDFIAADQRTLHLGDQVRHIPSRRVGKVEEERQAGALWRVFFSDGKQPILDYYGPDALELVHCPHAALEPGFVPTRGIF